MTRRFDRPGTTDERVHLQPLCALAWLDFNETGAHDSTSLFLAANNDHHTKNHSFTMNRDGIWRLSPAYDITLAYYQGNRWLWQRFMSVNGKFEPITVKDLLTVANQFGVERASDTKLRCQFT